MVTKAHLPCGMIRRNPDHDVDNQEPYFHEPLNKALAAIRKAEGGAE